MTDLLSPPQFPFPKEVTYVLTTTGKGFLETSRWDLLQNVGEDLLFNIIDLQYGVGEVIYHCRRLAEAYSEICFQYVKTFPPSPERMAFNSPYNHEAYYEFDALVIAAGRAYELASPPLWAAFHGGGDQPDNFQDTFKKLKADLPLDLANHLNMSWSKFGEKLRHYRTTVQHNSPVDHAMCSAGLKRLSGGVWIASLLIPDNPETKSRRKFEYTNLDALTYGWESTNEIGEVASAIVNASSQKSTDTCSR